MPTPFTEHPCAVGETCLQHMVSALRVWLWLIASSTVVFIHALLPFLFPTTGGDILKRAGRSRSWPRRSSEAEPT